MRLIIGHEHLDFDALASMVGARLMAGGGRLVKGHHMQTSVREYLSLHKDTFDLTSCAEFDEPTDVEEVIVVDMRNRGKLKPFLPLIEAAERVDIYDHHPATEDDIEGDNSVVEPVGACATLLTEAIQRNEVEPSPIEATLLAVGIYADTGSLSYDSTTPRDLDAAGWLLQHGARLPVVNRYLGQQFTEQQKLILPKLLESLETIDVGGLEVLIAPVCHPSYAKDIAAVVEHSLQLVGADTLIGLFHFEEDNKVQVIGRSRTRAVAIDEIFRELGGGGHPAAAAASLKNTDLESATKKLRQEIRNLDVSPERVADLMTSSVHALSREQSLSEAEQRLDDWDITGAPVVDSEGQLEGVLSIRDIRKAKKQDSMHVPVSGFMSQSVVTTTPETPIERSLREMTTRDVGRLPVVHEGQLVGIISRTDMLNRIYHS